MDSLLELGDLPVLCDVLLHRESVRDRSVAKIGREASSRRHKVRLFLVKRRIDRFNSFDFVSVVSSPCFSRFESMPAFRAGMNGARRLLPRASALET
jgi:hypothetical protein